MKDETAPHQTAGDNTGVIADSGGAGMIGLAWFLILAGVAFAGGAFAYDVGVGSGSGGLYGIPERVANVDKVAIRHMLLVCGVGCFISGWVLIGAEHVAAAIRRSQPQQT